MHPHSYVTRVQGSLVAPLFHSFHAIRAFIRLFFILWFLVDGLQAPLLNLLCARFQRDKIYTNVGGVLISVNPYKLIPKLYSLKAPSDANKALTGGSAAAAAGGGAEDAAAAVESDGPHVYFIAQNALEVRCCSHPVESVNVSQDRSGSAIHISLASFHVYFPFSASLLLSHSILPFLFSYLKFHLILPGSRVFQEAWSY
jgi:hypothetical protein